MLQEEQAKKIAKLLQLDEGKFLEALKSQEEMTLEMKEDLTVLDPTKLQSVKNKEYNKGKEVGIEQSIKTYREEHGLEFEGKSLDTLAEAVKAKALAEAKIEEPERVTKLQSDLNKVKETAQTLQKQLESKDQEILQAQNETFLFKNMPQLDEGLLPADRLMVLMQADGYKFENQEGKLVVTKDGEVLSNEHADPIPAKDVITKYSLDNKFHTPKDPNDPTPPKGRKGVDKPPSNKWARMSELKQHYNDMGKSTQGQEFMQAARQARIDNPDFDPQS